MNGSPSNASLTSSKKPSTANSSASNKRSRTIIVARNINDVPLSSSVPARAERPVVATSLSSSAGRLPGTNSSGFDTKLPTYAALGSSEDVGLYQKYLLEQTKSGHRSASELRNGANGGGHHSPQHLTVSMKRKTISQLSIGDSITSAADTTSSGSSHHQSTGSLPPRSGASADTANADTNSATRVIMQLEMEQDAKKRRDALVQRQDALVQRRKWLQTLPIHERLAHQRQQNALKHWQQINRDWEHFKTRACKKLGKTEKELVMTRAAKYREQVEMYDALQKAKPLSEKVGGDFWLVSLRGDGTRFVPVGNIFSGLFCPIRESTKLGPRIRRPLDHVDAKTTIYEDCGDQENGDNNTSNISSKLVSLLEKRSLELLARKKRRLRKQLQVLLPHEVNDSASSKLVVDTMDLFEWASRGDTNNNNSRAGTPESSVLSLPLGDSAMERAALMSQQSSSARNGSNLQLLSGPSLQISVLSLENGDDFYEKPQRSPRDTAEPEPLLLSFYGDTNHLLERFILLNNDGSSVLHYQWSREDFFHPSITPHLAQNEGLNNGSREVSSQSLKKKTFVSQTQGSILPGEQETFVFSFEAPKPGLFLEKWLLDVDPPAMISFGSVAGTNSSSSNSIVNLGCDNGLQQSPRSPTTKVSDCKPVEIHLKCTAVDNFTPTTQHLAQKHAIEKQKTVFMVEQLVGDVLKQVDSTPKVEFPELRNGSEMDQFYNLNKCAFGDVYYSDAFVGICRELYTQARQVLVSHTSVPASGVGDESDGASSAESSSQSVAFPQSTSSGHPTPNTVRVTARGSSRRLEPEGAGEQTEDVLHPSSVTIEEEERWDLSLSTLRTITRKADALNAAKRKELAKELQKLIEMEEEEEEEEDDEEEEDNEEDDEDEEEEDDDDDEDASPSQVAKPSKKLTVQEKKAARAARRVQILQERLQKRQELEAHIDLLRPQLQDAFQATYLEAYAAPYDSSALSDQLTQKIAHLCSEVPVIHGITRMLLQQQKQSNEDVRVETEKGVAQVLTRAIDEAITFDMEYQLQYEHERKRLHQVLLSDKFTFEQALEQLEGDQEPISNGPWHSKGVLLLHVDLDLANWFTLVKDTTALSSTSALAETGGALDPSTTTQASETQVLKWQFSPELLDRDDFVPEKVAKVAQSIEILTQLIKEASKSIPVKAIVLVSDLSSPPVTKPMKKLLMMTMKEKEQDERILLDGIAHQLTLQPVSQVLERAMGNCVASNNGDSSIQFCASIAELTEKLHLLSALTDEKTSGSSSIGEPAKEGETENGVFSSVEIASPKLFLTEHLKALAGGGGKKSNSSCSAFQEKPATPASTVPQPPVAAAAVAPPDPKSAAARKKSVAVSASQTKPTPVAAAVTPFAAIPATSPPVEQAATTRAEDKQTSATGETSLGSDTIAAERLQAKALGAQLAELCDAFMVDTFLSPPYESVFIPSNSGCNSGDEQQLEKKKEPMMILGPNLLKKVEQWTQILQPSLSTEEKKPWATITAVVGGKNLAGKLRLIDNLLEVADRIYFVGDVALGLYRVLFTKHDDKRKQWRKVSPQSPLSLWSILVPAVERLKQKARRKCVKLLLPVDWIVGETRLEEQDTTLSADDDDEDDDEEEDLEEEDDVNSKKARKKQLKANKPKKPILEPDEIDSWHSKPRQWQYDGEKAHVGIDTNGVVLSNGDLKSASDSASWISVFDVDLEIFSKFKVLSGKSSVLSSKSTATSEDEDEDDTDNDGSDPSHDDATTSSKNADSNMTIDKDSQEMMNASELDNPTNFEFEWTLRAFDVGPESMKILLSQLQQTMPTNGSHQLIVHGLFGVVECRDFDCATREFVSFLEAEWTSSSYSQAQTQGKASAPPDSSSSQSQQHQPQQRECKLLLSGESTLEWIQQLRRTKPKETQGQSQYLPTLVMNQDRKMAYILRDVLAAKSNAMLLSLNPPPPAAEAQVEEIVAKPNDAEDK